MRSEAPFLTERKQIERASPITSTKMKKNRAAEPMNTGAERRNLFTPQRLGIAASSEKP
jgi:hypothetical protein